MTWLLIHIFYATKRSLFPRWSAEMLGERDPNPFKFNGQKHLPFQLGFGWCLQMAKAETNSCFNDWAPIVFPIGIVPSIGVDITWKVWLIGMACFLQGEDLNQIEVISNASKAAFLSCERNGAADSERFNMVCGRKSCTICEQWITLLGGGFKYFLCSPVFGQDSHFD